MRLVPINPLRGAAALLSSLVRRTRRPDAPRADDRLELCGVCAHDFVVPVQWEPVGPERWRLLLRCGQCATWRDVTVTNAVARRYDIELNRRTDVLVASLDRLEREQLVAMADAMGVALALGLIDAADFADGR